MQPGRVLEWSAVLILAGGLGCSLIIWREQVQKEREAELVQSANPASSLSAQDSGKHARDVEVYYGKSGLLMEQFQESPQGKALAKVVAAGSSLLATGIFLVSRKFPR